MTTRAERIAEIRERAEKATPGPWRANVPFDRWEEHLAESCSQAKTNAEADASFIAHARQDVPWLLAEVERLEGRIRAIVPGIWGTAVINGPGLGSTTG